MATNDENGKKGPANDNADLSGEVKGGKLLALEKQITQAAKQALLKFSVSALEEGASGFVELRKSFEDEIARGASVEPEQIRIANLAYEMHDEFVKLRAKYKAPKQEREEDDEIDAQVNKLNPRGFKAVA